MSHPRSQDGAAETTRSTSERTAIDDPLRDSLDELSRLADSLVDGLAEPEHDATAAPPAASESPAIPETAERTESARKSLNDTIEQLGQFADPEPPLRSGEPILEGDRGEDIDAFLDALLTPDEVDTPITAVPPATADATPPETDVVVELAGTPEPQDDDPIPALTAASAEGVALPSRNIEDEPESETVEGAGEPDGPDDPSGLTPPEYHVPDVTEPGRTAGAGLGWWIAVAIVIAIVAGGAWWVMIRRDAPGPTTSRATPRPAATPEVESPALPADSPALSGVAAVPLAVAVTEIDGSELESLTLPDAAAPAAAEPAAAEPEAADLETAAATPRPRRSWTQPPPPRLDAVNHGDAATPTADEPVAEVVADAVATPAETTANTPAPATSAPSVTFVPGPAIEPEETLRVTMSTPGIDDDTPSLAMAAPSGDDDLGAATVPEAITAPTIVAAAYRPPLLLERQEPEYPARALKRGVQGEVVLRVLVGETGSVVRVVVDEGPDAVLEAAAIEAVLHWRYRPASDGGAAVRGWVTERFAFKP